MCDQSNWVDSWMTRHFLLAANIVDLSLFLTMSYFSLPEGDFSLSLLPHLLAVVPYPLYLTENKYM